MTTREHLALAALGYARRGWAVFPLHNLRPNGTCSCGNLNCKPNNRAKHPRTRNGLKDATTDEGQIRAWWGKWPDANIGIATGAASGIVVLDVDPDKGGKESLTSLELEYGLLPETPTSLTGGGGRHIVFAHPGQEVKNSASKLGPGLDVRGDGGYIVAPPSLHASGAFYDWLVSPDDAPLATIPAWLLELMQKPTHHTPVVDASERTNGRKPAEPMTRHEKYAQAALQYECDHLAGLGEGSRNDGLNVAAFKLGGLVALGLLDRADVERALESACVANGLIEDDGREAFAKTLKSGLAAGINNPRELPEPEPIAPQKRARILNGPPEPPPFENDEPAGFDVLGAIRNAADGTSAFTLACDHVGALAAFPKKDVLGVLNLLRGKGVPVRSIAELKAAIKDERKRQAQVAGGPREKPKTDDYVGALRDLGYTFRLNECNDDVEVNGHPLTDALRAKIRAQMRDIGFENVNVMEDAYTAHAYDHRYHPVRDYLNSLEWDGGDHLALLSGFFPDTHNPITYPDGRRRSIFYAWLLRWMVGAVAKAMEGGQNVMLVLDGPQDIGKSYFARWLGSPLPRYYIESPINPDEKDAYVRLISKWIWEVAELGATTRKADREALKHFVTIEQVTVRKAYGRHDINKPALASLIGTINNEAGFLNDPTGNRRFLVCSLTGIDWDYSEEIDVNQLWAQATALYRKGEPWRLHPVEKQAQRAINAGYEVEDALEGYLHRCCTINLDRDDWWTSTSDIVRRLEGNGYRGTTRQIQMELAQTAKRLGLKRSKREVWGYHGITLNDSGPTAPLAPPDISF